MCMNCVLKGLEDVLSKNNFEPPAPQLYKGITDHLRRRGFIVEVPEPNPNMEYKSQGDMIRIEEIMEEAVEAKKREQLALSQRNKMKVKMASIRELLEAYMANHDCERIQIDVGKDGYPQYSACKLCTRATGVLCMEESHGEDGGVVESQMYREVCGNDHNSVPRDRTDDWYEIAKRVEAILSSKNRDRALLALDAGLMEANKDG